MKQLLRRTWVIVALAISNAGAISVQENYTICNWPRLRAGAVRDAIYLDGGMLWWQTAFVDGTAPVVSSDGNVEGDMFRLNLSRPFDTTQTNMSGLLDRMPKAGGAGNNIAPNYIDGTMMVNYDELYLYGGLPRLTDSASPQSEDSILGYEADQYGPYRASWSPGFYQGTLSSGVTRYITNGAGVSAPSENLGFYFSGMRQPDWGPIYFDDSSANTLANTLIEVDMSTMRSEQWSNSTLPNDIPARANAELVWVPVAKRGVLLAIGGVTAPEEIWAIGLNDTQSTQSKTTSPSFMTSIPIYDVASKQWFSQNTTGDTHPPQLTEFCSVIATSDYTSFDVYIYGGYDGLNSQDAPSDDVWVLSIPSFTWTKVYSGTSSHGRSGHRCLAPYPDKMFVIGGQHQGQTTCVEGGFIQVFDLNTLQFQNTYDPNDWKGYNPPAALSSTSKTKRQVVWSDPQLASIFSTKYANTDKIQNFYPYKSTETNTSSPGSTNSHGPSNTVIIAIGVAAGIVSLILITVLILIFRRRHILKSTSSESSATKRSRVSRWVLGTGGTPIRVSKNNHNESKESLAPETQQIAPYITDRPASDPPTPDFRITSPLHHRNSDAPSEMSAAVERPLPPFELATPYNSASHPRTSGVVDYAYNTNKGHSPSHSNDSSTSSDYNQEPVELHSPINSHTHLHTTAREPELAHGSPSTSSASSTPSWPLPSQKPTWKRQPSDEDRRQSQPQFLYPPVPSMPAQYRSISSGEPDRLRPILPDSTASGNSSNSHASTDPFSNKVSSLSSETDARDLSSLPSPESSLPPGKYGEEYRQSLMSAISPVSPDEPRPHWGVDSYNGASRQRSGSHEGGETWWR